MLAAFKQRFFHRVSNRPTAASLLLIVLVWLQTVSYLPATARPLAAADTLTITKRASTSRAEVGSVVSYTVSVGNSGTAAVSANTILRDSLTNGLSAVMASVVSSYGSVSTVAPGLRWNVSGLPASTTVTMTYQATVTAEGVSVNYATIPGSATASACLTVPVRVCAGTLFEFELTAPASYTAYQWTRNGLPIPGATGNVLSVTAVGDYGVGTISAAGCADGSCCPFVVVEETPPSLSAIAQSARCVGLSPQDDAAITLASSSSNAVSYNITQGSSFTAGTPIFSAPKPLSEVAVGSNLLSGQRNPGAPTDYTIRVYTANGCFADFSVTLQPVVCPCPPLRCYPVAVWRSKAGGLVPR